MKTLTTKLSLLLVALALAFVACDKDPIEDPKPEPQPEIELQITSGTQEVVSPEGGEVVITYATSAETEEMPEASCEAEWISDIVVSEGEIALTVAANEAEEVRKAEVVISFNAKNYGVEIEQEGKAKENPEPEPQPETYEYTMATAERDDSETENNFSIVFSSVDGKTKLIAHLVGNEGDTLLEAGTYSSADATLDLDKTLFKTENGLVELTDAEATVTVEGEKYNFDITLTDTKQNKHIVLYTGVVANMEQMPAGPEAFTPAKVVASYSMIGNFRVLLYIDNERYHELDMLDEVAPNDDYLSAGAYTYTNGTIGTSSTYCSAEGSCPLEDAELTLAHNEDEGTTQIVGFIKSAKGDHITIEWSGTIEGFSFAKDEPTEPANVVVEITSAKVNYDIAGAKQILFTGAEQSHQLYFVDANILASKPVPDGTYSLADGTMDARYCLHDYGTTDAEMSDIVVQITNNDDNTTHFVANWKANGANYSFDWTGEVEGYQFEDVAGNALVFHPTYVEMTDAGFAGIYFYFYDEAENELVLNYDGGKIYMPYINYEKQKINISTDDYTFEYSVLEDGLYYYNVRLVTLDERTIEFSGALPTEEN